MYTTVVYHQILPPNTPPTPLDPVADPHIRVEGKNIIIPEGMNFYLGCRLVSTYFRPAYLDAPSLRRFMYHWIDGGSDYYGTDIYTFFDNRFYNPLPLDNFEPMRIVADNPAGMVSATWVAVVFIGDGPQTPVTGDIYTVKAIGKGQIQAFKWSNVALSFADTLPAGRYQLVGASLADPNVVVIRFVFVGQAWRPGVLSRGTYRTPGHDIFRHGRAGVLGEFPHDQPPTVDVFASYDTEELPLYLDLIKVG
ncbi:MAG: hypothetical protein QXT84_01995 [Candidatus Bathyarchaeia archaeon]